MKSQWRNDLKPVRSTTRTLVMQGATEAQPYDCLLRSHYSLLHVLLLVALGVFIPEGGCNCWDF